MGWLDKIFKPKKENTTWAQMLNGLTPIYTSFGRDIYASDVVQQAVKCIVDEMKKLQPMHVVEDGTDITPQRSSVQNVLNRPNQMMTRSDFIEKMTWILLLDYNAFAIPVYDSWIDEKGNEKRNYKAIYPVRPSSVTFIQDATDELFIKMDFLNGHSTTLPYADVIHLKYKYSVSEFMGGNLQGRPDHEALIKTLEINENMMKGIDSAMRSSFAVNAVVKYNSMLDKGKLSAALKELEEKLQNSESGFLPLDLKSEFIPIKKDVKLVDADTLKFIDSKILRHWGVSLPILTGDFTKDQLEAFYQKTIEPLIVAWSDEFSRVFFPGRAFSYGNRVKFYTKNLLFMSMSETLEMIRLLGDSGTLWENEKRIAVGLPPDEALNGVRMQSLNYVNTEIANQYQTGGNGGSNEQKEE